MIELTNGSEFIHDHFRAKVKDLMAPEIDPTDMTTYICGLIHELSSGAYDEEYPVRECKIIRTKNRLYLYDMDRKRCIYDLLLKVVY